MIKAEIRYILLIVILLVAGGCCLPRPPQVVNVQLPDNVPIYAYHQERAGRANAGVLAYCEDVKEYAKTVQGNWEKHWNQIVFEVIKVTYGEWGDTNLIFVCYDSWPTPESGIVLGKALFPYRQGMVFHFWIDTSKKPPLIVAQQERSRIPPHGMISRPSWEFKDNGFRSNIPE